MNAQDSKTIGRAPTCGLQLNDPSVSRIHAAVQVTPEGYLAIQDRDSSNGTWLHRNGRWVRARRIVLGTRDRIRFGDEEVPLEHLVELFGQQGRVRLHDAYAVRGRPLLIEGDAPRGRAVFENPRRNPLTGDIEDVRPQPRDDRS
ncbi:MAG: FHA domain-containing protein [Xanthomonadales bacterium]